MRIFNQHRRHRRWRRRSPARRWCCIPTATRACRSTKGGFVAACIPGARFVPLESAQPPACSRTSRHGGAALEEVARVPTGEATRRRRVRRAHPARARLVELIAQGLDNAQIAAQLGLSEKTVRNHITRIFAKLEVENRSQAIVLARDAGFGAEPR